MNASGTTFVLWLDELTSSDTPSVGGKNSSLGELVTALGDAGIRVPAGFATSAAAYRRFLATNELEGPIRDVLARLSRDQMSLADAGRDIRELIVGGQWPEPIAEAIRDGYGELCERVGRDDVDVAVRSSATAEDLPEASFAGQQETYLNVRGPDALLDACKRCYASLFTDRAIIYRELHGFDHLEVALSVGVQQMVRSDLAGAGVMFTLDVDTGCPRLVFINAAWGLGENVVQGTIEPDQIRLFKPWLERGRPAVVEAICGAKEQKLIYGADGESTTVNVDTSPEERDAFVLSEDELAQLGRWAIRIERHYGRPMDIEWAKDGHTGQLFVVQARPETVHAQKRRNGLRSYHLDEEGTELVTGLAVGQAIATGKVCRLRSIQDMDRFESGDVLVTSATDPDWLPVMRRAAAIVTDHGGRTSHAAIVSRELGVPAVVGTVTATEILRDGQEVTVSCAGGSDEGHVFEGTLAFESHEVSLDDVPRTHTRVLMNIASPAAALAWWRLPVRGIGLARMEYLVNHVIRVHPMALVHPEKTQDADTRARIRAITRRYRDGTEYFVDQLARGIALMAAARHPDPVVVRMSDFKSNEYAKLLGGAAFEPAEPNPMLGWRGASRYYDDDYREGFALECRALARARRELGFENVVVMIPFCRTPGEADRVLEIMAEHGLRRGDDGLKVWVMAEIPSNIIQAEDFAERFDGFSIGSNDLTQLVLGVSRDSEKLRHLFDERNPSVTWMIRELCRRAHAAGTTVSICGQAPSDYPEFAAFLVDAGLDSISVNPDSVLATIENVARAEASRQPPTYPDERAGSAAPG